MQISLVSRFIESTGLFFDISSNRMFIQSKEISHDNEKYFVNKYLQYLESSLPNLVLISVNWIDAPFEVQSASQDSLPRHYVRLFLKLQKFFVKIRAVICTAIQTAASIVWVDFMHCFVSGGECFCCFFFVGMEKEKALRQAPGRVMSPGMGSFDRRVRERFSTHPRLLFAFMCHPIAIWKGFRVSDRTIAIHAFYPHPFSLPLWVFHPLPQTVPAYSKTKVRNNDSWSEVFCVPPLSILPSLPYIAPFPNPHLPSIDSLLLLFLLASVFSSVWGGRAINWLVSGNKLKWTRILLSSFRPQYRR